MRFLNTWWTWNTRICHENLVSVNKYYLWIFGFYFFLVFIVLFIFLKHLWVDEVWYRCSSFTRQLEMKTKPNYEKWKLKTAVLFNALKLQEPRCGKLHGFVPFSMKKEYTPLISVHGFKVFIRLCGKTHIMPSTCTCPLTES